MKQSEAMRLVTKLASYFPPVPDDTRMAYVAKLVDEEVGYIEVAIDELVETERRLPPIARIFEVAYRQQRLDSEVEEQRRRAELMREEEERYQPMNLDPNTREKVLGLLGMYFSRHPEAEVFRKRYREGKGRIP